MHVTAASHDQQFKVMVEDFMHFMQTPGAHPGELLIGLHWVNTKLTPTEVRACVGAHIANCESCEQLALVARQASEAIRREHGEPKLFDLQHVPEERLRAAGFPGLRGALGEFIEAHIEICTQCKKIYDSARKLPDW